MERRCETFVLLLEDRNKSRPEGVCVGGGLFLSCSLIFPKIDGLVSIVLSRFITFLWFSVELAVWLFLMTIWFGVDLSNDVPPGVASRLKYFAVLMRRRTFLTLLDSVSVFSVLNLSQPLVWFPIGRTFGIYGRVQAHFLRAIRLLSWLQSRTPLSTFFLHDV